MQRWLDLPQIHSTYANSILSAPHGTRTRYTCYQTHSSQMQKRMVLVLPSVSIPYLSDGIRLVGWLLLSEQTNHRWCVCGVLTRAQRGPPAGDSNNLAAIW